MMKKVCTYCGILFNEIHRPWCKKPEDATVIEWEYKEFEEYKEYNISS